jgi:hypothetical protein
VSTGWPRRAALAAALALGCAHALHEPRPLAPAGGPAAGGPQAAQQLLGEARASFDRRPDVDAVRRAERLFTEAAAADPGSTAALGGAIQAKIWLADHEPDAAVRRELAASAVDAGQWCERRAPDDPACSYGLALALGIQARENRATALDGVKVMVEKLRRAAAADPRLDHAGPERVLALVLLRAPAWPVGPGDKDAALEEARKAVALFADYPPNQLALAEVLAGNGANDDALVAAQRAAELAQARAAAGDPDAPEWLAQARKLGAAPAAPGKQS